MSHYKALNDKNALITGINGFMAFYLAKKMFCLCANFLGL